MERACVPQYARRLFSCVALVFDVLPLAGWIKKEGAVGRRHWRLGPRSRRYRRFRQGAEVPPGARPRRVRGGTVLPCRPVAARRPAGGGAGCAFICPVLTRNRAACAALPRPVFRQPSAVPGTRSQAPKAGKCRFEMSAKKDAKKFFQGLTFIRNRIIISSDFG